MSVQKDNSMPGEKLIKDLLESLDNLFGLHPGFRPVHAKGIMCLGFFVPAPEANELCFAKHIVRDEIKVIVRFSNFAGVPSIPDNAPNGSGPRGFAVRFFLGDHVHTDIVAHSYDGFPVATGEEFLEFAQALAASGPDATKPTALDSFCVKYPRAKQFLEAPKPIPTSYAVESFFGVNAYKFTNRAGNCRYGRFRILPEGGSSYLSGAEAAKQTENFLHDELIERLKSGPIKMNVLVQIAKDGDIVDDGSVSWPNDREEIKFGTITITAPANDQDPELRRIIFDPIPRVESIDPSSDPLIQVRSEIYLMSGRRRRQQK